MGGNASGYTQDQTGPSGTYTKILEHLEEIRDAAALTGRTESPYIKDWYVEQIQMDTGCVIIQIHMYEKYYYEMLSEMTGTTITGQYDLIKTMQKLSILKNEYEM